MQRRPFFILQAVVAVALILVMLAIFVIWIMGGRVAPPGLEARATQQTPQNVEATRQQAQQLYLNGQYSQAIALYQTLTETNPQSQGDWIELARLQVYGGQTTEAIKSAETAIRLDHNSSPAYAIYALALDWNGQTAKAADEVVLAIQLDPTNAMAYAYYADILLEQNQDTSASDAAQQALQLDPKNVVAQSAYGYYLNSINSYESAKHELLEALAQEPANPDLHGRLGLIYFRALDYQKAVVELGCAVEGCTTPTDTLADAVGTPDLTINKLALTQRTLEYFYTYSAVLSALSTPGHNTCQRAADLNQEIRAFVTRTHGNDFVLDILSENESICAYAGQAAFICGPAAPHCNSTLKQAQKDLGFQIRLPAALLHDYTLTNLGYDTGLRRLELGFVKGNPALGTLYIFQGIIPKPGEGIDWSLGGYSANSLQSVQLGNVVGQYVPGVAGQNPADPSDQTVKLYWQVSSMEYLIYRTLPTADSKNQFVALAQAMLSQAPLDLFDDLTPTP